jgi:hypothetical protein
MSVSRTPSHLSATAGPLIPNELTMMDADSSVRVGPDSNSACAPERYPASD